jgi:hypothetical protein
MKWNRSVVQSFCIMYSSLAAFINPCFTHASSISSTLILYLIWIIEKPEKDFEMSRFLFNKSTELFDHVLSIKKKLIVQMMELFCFWIIEVHYLRCCFTIYYLMPEYTFFNVLILEFCFYPRDFWGENWA